MSEWQDIRIFALRVRLLRLVDALDNCNELDMGDHVVINLDLWEGVLEEIKDCRDILSVQPPPPSIES